MEPTSSVFRNQRPRLGPCECCSGNVSSHAHTCPHCGHPFPYLGDEDDFLGLMRADQYFGAIVAIRRRFGWQIEKVKEYVDGLKIRIRLEREKAAERAKSDPE